MTQPIGGEDRERAHIRVSITRNPPSLSDVVSFLRSCCRECGALTIYVGIVKPFSSSGSRVVGMEIECSSSALKELESGVAKVLEDTGCKAIYVWHREGFAKPGEELSIIGAIGLTRHEVVEAVRRCIEVVKSCKSIVRKEVTE